MKNYFDRDVYSPEYLARPFDMDTGMEMPQIGGAAGATAGMTGGADAAKAGGKGISSGVAGGLGAIGASMDSLIRSGMKTSEFTPSGFASRRDKINNAQGKIENALISSGNPYAMAAGAIAKGSRALDNTLRDGNGLYKSKGAKWAASIIDPATGLRNLATGELFNSDKLQRQVTEAQRMKDMNSVVQAQEAGQRIASSIPSYKAPAYGKLGMKLKTKFSLQ